jgi:hypothetical protein
MLVGLVGRGACHLISHHMCILTLSMSFTYFPFIAAIPYPFNCTFLNNGSYLPYSVDTFTVFTSVDMYSYFVSHSMPGFCYQVDQRKVRGELWITA